MTLWDATSGLCTEAGLCTGAAISRQQHLQLCLISSSAHSATASAVQVTHSSCLQG